ncbi:MAG: YdcF family protein [Candidatus Pacebacteria bacterium]|nr:YdcF family protein [Candidatus Paceibacterota bacterium]
MVQVIVVLGAKLEKDGAISVDFHQRLLAAVNHVRRGEHPYLLISGGQTRAEYAAESLVAYRDLEQYLRERNLEKEVTVFLETASKTTPENIIKSQALLEERGVVPDELVFVGSECQIPKTVVLASKLWKLGSPAKIFIATSDPRAPLVQWINVVFFTALSWFDPRGVSFVYRLLKMGRNG